MLVKKYSVFHDTSAKNNTDNFMIYLTFTRKDTSLTFINLYFSPVVAYFCKYYN